MISVESGREAASLSLRRPNLDAEVSQRTSTSVPSRFPEILSFIVPMEPLPSGTPVTKQLLAAKGIMRDTKTPGSGQSGKIVEMFMRHPRSSFRAVPLGMRLQCVSFPVTRLVWLRDQKNPPRQHSNPLDERAPNQKPNQLRRTKHSRRLRDSIRSPWQALLSLAQFIDILPTIQWHIPTVQNRSLHPTGTVRDPRLQAPSNILRMLLINCRGWTFLVARPPRSGYPKLRQCNPESRVPPLLRRLLRLCQVPSPQWQMRFQSM